MKNTLLLFKHFLKNPKEVGAIVPSSSFLTEEIIKNIDFKNTKTIIELGPGLGVFTKAILKNARKDAHVYCIEVNKTFCVALKKEVIDERLNVINRRAENLSIILQEHKIKKVQCIVSGIPFLNLSTRQRKTILNQVKNSIDKQGIFILFQYTRDLAELLSYYFKNVERTIVPLNIPPAFVYFCTV